METPHGERLARELAEFVSRVLAETGVPGLAVALSIRGTRVAACAGARTLGEPRPLARDDRFHIGCATKLLLAIVTLELADAGRLALDAPIVSYLPELRGCVHGETVELAHLLSHTSGYLGTSLLDPATRSLSWPTLVAYLHRAPQLFPPGSVYSYEHTESVLLGRIVAHALGRDPLMLMRETLLAPLGIRPGELEEDLRAGRDAGRHELDRGSGRFAAVTNAAPITDFWLPAFSRYTMTLDDLLTLAEAILQRGASPTIARLLEPVVALPPTTGGPLRELLPVAFGLGAAKLRDGFHGMSGITHGQCLGLRFDPRSGIGIAAGINAVAPHLRDFVLATLCRELTHQTIPPERRPFEFDLAELEGRYIGPGGSAVVARLIDERLHCEIAFGATAGARLEIDLVLDDDGVLVMRSPAAHLSLGFFQEPRSGSVGLMLGLSAYKRVG
jgi:CubicO group peptidase (beta-lactamase class C family)